MSGLFSADWMNGFMSAWNATDELSGALEKIGFNSVIGYGFPGDDAPSGVITVENGKVTAAGPFDGQNLSWDMRASEEQWGKWMKKAPGMAGLGLAVTSGKLKFKVGDYGAMLKDPRMANPFIKSFSVMGAVA
jgi:hypothetical protein